MIDYLKKCSLCGMSKSTIKWANRKLEKIKQEAQLCRECEARETAIQGHSRSLKVAHCCANRCGIYDCYQNDKRADIKSCSIYLSVTMPSPCNCVNREVSGLTVYCMVLFDWSIIEWKMHSILSVFSLALNSNLTSISNRSWDIVPSLHIHTSPVFQV